MDVCRVAIHELDESSTESWLSNRYAVPAEPDEPEAEVESSVDHIVAVRIVF
jgi:hypothetical protein